MIFHFKNHITVKLIIKDPQEIEKILNNFGFKKIQTMRKNHQQKIREAIRRNFKEQQEAAVKTDMYRDMSEHELRSCLVDLERLLQDSQHEKMKEEYQQRIDLINQKLKGE